MRPVVFCRRRLSVLLRLAVEGDGDEEGDAEENGVVEGAEEVEGTCGEACVFKDSDGDEELGAVGNEALDGAGGGVEDAGNAAAIATIFVGKVFGDGAADDDGDGIVCREEVDATDEGHDA